MPTTTMTDEARAAAFRQLWSRSMHWAFDSMADAVRTWRAAGIKGLPRFTEAAGRMLAADIAKNEAFLASIRT